MYELKYVSWVYLWLYDESKSVYGERGGLKE